MKLSFPLSLLPLAFMPMLSAQSCSDNVYPITLVDALGVPAPMGQDPVTLSHYAQFASEDVYMAFDPNMPSGTYYVHVTDRLNHSDMVLSTNDPMDRFVQITNTNGVITLSLPMSSNTPVTGLGLGGQGQSLLLQPFVTNPLEPCQFKAWCGDTWDLSYGPTYPYLLQGGLKPNSTECAIRSHESFRIGDGSIADLSGTVFMDANQNGEQDPTEPGLAGWTVSLVTPGNSVTAVTDSQGGYTFPNVAGASYTIELAMQPAYSATTPVVYQLEVCGCADVEAAPFGVASACLPCDGHTIGYWGNCNGLQKVQHYGILPTLPALGIVNGCGQRVAPATLSQFDHYLQGANSVNMAYMLSAQLVAMHCNVLSGFVDPNAAIQDSILGQISIATLMQMAVTSLWAHPLTLTGSPFRAEQAALKNALDRANNNQNWVTACGCTTNSGGCGTGGSQHGGGSCGGHQPGRRGPYRRRHHC